MDLRLLARPLAPSLAGPVDDKVSVEGPSGATSSLLTLAQAPLSSSSPLHRIQLLALSPYGVLPPPPTPPPLPKNTSGCSGGDWALARSQGTEEVHQEAWDTTEVMCLREKKWSTKNTKEFFLKTAVRDGVWAGVTQPHPAAAAAFSDGARRRRWEGRCVALALPSFPDEDSKTLRVN